MSSNEPKKQITSDDADKLGLPTSLEDIFSFGEEGKSIADIVGLLGGADKKDDLAIGQRTNITDTEEASVIAEALFVAKYPLVLTDDWKRRLKNGEWFIPELKDEIVSLLRIRTSIGGKSIDKVVEALQSIKIKVESQKTQQLNQI